MNETRTGRIAEELAARRLSEDGWTLLDRNYRDGPREIDLIARRGDVVAFIEVKARRSAGHHHPLEAIGHAKRRDLARAARRWIRVHGRASESYRFDAIAVLNPHAAQPAYEHIEDAWRL